MSKINTILAESSASISELKKNPMATIAGGEGAPVAILNHNRPVFYCIPAATYERILDQLENSELAKIANQRRGGKTVKMAIDDL